MDWLNDWNKALAYLEANLDRDIDPKELGRLAGCSAYHFQRMFSYLAGIPLGEYIRRRRMTRAAADLQNGEKVLDVALRYGYESPTAFNRAFQAVHKLPPSQAKQEGVKLKAFPSIHFKFVLKGAEEMEYQIEKREAFRIVGFRTPLPMDVEKSFQVVPKFWAEIGPRQAELVPLMNGEPAGMLGVCTCDEEENFYYIAVASSAPAPEGMHEWMVPAATWAVFAGTGRLPEAMQELQKRIVSEYLPDSGYGWAKAPDIEVYLNRPGEESRFQVWLPVTMR
ncbi:AraC family transcriptional regulator [uncultured Oscillibacter sp.]|uniref:AraC family transcriptional regulator n=1 Tax=uncultured Oscillibacter sp. TaxID=876091 RepID=UPI00272B5C02|nr:AraC family transcriptional regulator [uncultured Oscillibacter sp.]